LRFCFLGLSPEILWNIEALRSSRRFVVPDDLSSVVVGAVGRVGQAVVVKALVFIAGLTTSQLPFMGDVVTTFNDVVVEMSSFANNIDQVLLKLHSDLKLCPYFPVFPCNCLVAIFCLIENLKKKLSVSPNEYGDMGSLGFKCVHQPASA